MTVQARVVVPPAFACVVAADEARGIGRDNKLPWPRLRGDIAHLKQITTATREPLARNAVVMGRRSWDSIPRRYQPLAGRLNIVVSRGAPALPAGVILAGALEGALAAALDGRVESIHVLGGGQLFAEAVLDPRCQVIYYTRVAGRFEADTFFPPFEASFARQEVSPPRQESGVAYQIEIWQRR